MLLFLSNTAFEAQAVSVIEIYKNIPGEMSGKGNAENTGNENLETLKMDWANDKSSKKNKLILGIR